MCWVQIDDLWSWDQLLFSQGLDQFQAYNGRGWDWQDTWLHSIVSNMTLEAIKNGDAAIWSQIVQPAPSPALRTVLSLKPAVP
jgi:hypothetical protein